MGCRCTRPLGQSVEYPILERHHTPRGIVRVFLPQRLLAGRWLLGETVARAGSSQPTRPSRSGGVARVSPARRLCPDPNGGGVLSASRMKKISAHSLGTRGSRSPSAQAAVSSRRKLDVSFHANSQKHMRRSTSVNFGQERVKKAASNPTRVPSLVGLLSTLYSIDYLPHPLPSRSQLVTSQHLHILSPHLEFLPQHLGSLSNSTSLHRCLRNMSLKLNQVSIPLVIV